MVFTGKIIAIPFLRENKQYTAKPFFEELPAKHFTVVL